jgi:hypothetical protein
MVSDFPRIARSLNVPPMRHGICFALVLMLAVFITPVHAQSADDDLRVYAVNIVKTRPFAKQFTGYGIYLGQGIVITAAHVVGRWPFFTHPRVLMAGQDLPAKIIKMGSFDDTDLAVLSVDESTLPISLQLRRNPLCKDPPRTGMQVIDVVPERTTRARVISPLAIPSQFRERFNTLIDDAEVSGSGLFDAERLCLLGIMSAKIQAQQTQTRNSSTEGSVSAFAGYFVSAEKIASFIPIGVHF